MCAAFLGAQAQNGDRSATLMGTVRDADQRPVADALVTLQADSGNNRLQSRTDAHGRYSFKPLAAGRYTLHAENAANQAVSTPLSLSEAETKTIDLNLAATPSGRVPEFYDEPSFTVAGVSESSGAGVHGSQSTMRNADALAKSTASLAKSPAGLDVNHGRTIEQLHQLIAADDQAQLHNQLGHLEEDSGASLEALREFQRAAEMDPSESNYFDWGTELLTHRTAEPAGEVFAKGHSLHPQSVRLLTGLAVAAYAQGSYHAAVDDLCQASDLDPRDPIPYTFLGRMENPEVKRSASALARLGRYAELYPNNALANYYYAVALWNQPEGATRNTQVEQLLRKSLAIDPKLAPAYLQLGVLEAARQQFPEAVSSFERASALDPGLAEAHYRLAQAYRRLGESAKAQRELEIYQRDIAAEDEDAKRQQKNVQQFVYELKAPQPPSRPQ